MKPCVHAKLNFGQDSQVRLVNSQLQLKELLVQINDVLHFIVFYYFKELFLNVAEGADGLLTLIEGVSGPGVGHV